MNRGLEVFADTEKYSKQGRTGRTFSLCDSICEY